MDAEGKVVIFRSMLAPQRSLGLQYLEIEDRGPVGKEAEDEDAGGDAENGNKKKELQQGGGFSPGGAGVLHGIYL